MYSLLLLCLVGVVYSLPTRLGNPDENGPYFQGDMKLPFPKAKNGILSEEYRWTNGLVPFIYDANFDEAKKPMVESAIQTYLDITGGCITFIPKSNQTSYIVFTDNEETCSSNVGRIGGTQFINYNLTCIESIGSVLHEMYHALGFFHEQSRPDRDDYVIIDYDNIDEENWSQVAKYSDEFVGTFGSSYDYGSLMHSSEYFFSNNSKPTIITKDFQAQDDIGQRYGLSLIDLDKLKNMYNCTT